MLTIIIGIAIAVIILFVLGSLCDGLDGVSFIFAVIIIFAVLIGVCSPISGYEEWELIRETELISLSNDVASGGTGMLYVSLSADNVYTYRYEISSEFGTETSKEYTTKTITGGDVEEIEDPNCKVPVIRVYEKEAKRTIWTFGLYSKIKYVFYVPEGTIAKEVRLN